MQSLYNTENTLQIYTIQYIGDLKNAGERRMSSSHEEYYILVQRA